MRRIVAILLLLVAPLQMSWAAAAAYCAHETGPGTRWHIGHHDHAMGHAHHEAAADDSSASTTAQVDDCHGHGGAQLMVTTLPMLVHAAPSAVQPVAVPLHPSEHIESLRRPPKRFVVESRRAR